MKDSKKTETATVRAGFTLVELVVVIAILGILAGVAYPAYTGYIQRAKDAKVVTQLSEVLVSVQSARVAAGDTAEVEEITVDFANKTLTVKPAVAPENTVAFKDAIVQLGGGTTGYFTGAGTPTDGVDVIAINPDKFKVDGTSYNGKTTTWTGGENGTERWSEPKET